MKNLFLIFFFCCCIFLITSCSSSVYYLGDSFPKTNSLDIYYAEKDVLKKYKTIGQLTNGKFINYSVETIKNDMIKAAKENGADGIIIYDSYVERVNEETGDRMTVKAKLIKYFE
jgi:hypothetical protein